MRGGSTDGQETTRGGRTDRRLVIGPDRATGSAVGAATGGALSRDFLAPRAPDLRGAIERLDAELDDTARAELAAWIREAYERSHGDVPMGFVARCFLGPPFVDHTLDLMGVITRHFAPFDPMPEPFARARMLARSGGYAYIEVYATGLVIPVLPDGRAVRP
ncbi:hypothetical protein ACIBG6_16535 [Streptomyces sp. NPDC050842]|uniref:hypothetical protein n=1 Tax=Streptomyces sp. NPDC050842 TaxID=3365636 RepID=UPI0037A73EE6